MIIWHTLDQKRIKCISSLAIFFCILWDIVHNQVEPLGLSAQSFSLSVRLANLLLALFGRELCFCQPFFKDVAVKG